MLDLINLPYCFLFIPLILSCFNTLQNYKTTNLVITISCIFSILFLSFYLFPDVLLNGFLENKINDEVLFIGGEYKITTLSLIFIISIFSVKLLSFMFFDDQIIETKKLNLFFAIYLINYFSICGILTSNNLFNIYIYSELYSFSLYNIMSDYKIKNYNRITFKYYNNVVLGSIFFVFFVLIVYFTFGTVDISLIKKSLPVIENNYIYNLSIVVLMFAILFKFFSFNFYFSGILKSQNVSNLMFLNILFGDIIIGVYILWKFLFSLFDINLIFNILYLKYLFYFFGSYLIIANSYLIFKRENLLPISYGFCLISIGYIIVLLGLDSKYQTVSIISFLANHVLFDFLFYIIVAFCIKKTKKSDIGLLYIFYKYRFLIYGILLSKLLFPIGFSFNSYWNFLLSAIENKEYFLFIPIIFEKVMVSFLFMRCYFIFAREHKEKYNILELNQEIKLNNNHIVVIIILIIFIILLTIFEGYIVDILLKSGINGGLL